MLIIPIEVIKVYRLLTQRRIALDMTIDEIAEKSGIPKNTVAKIMSGITTDPRISSLKSIANALGLTLDDLDNFEKQSQISINGLSAEAMQLALDFDRLTEEGKRLATGFMVLVKQVHSKS